MTHLKRFAIAALLATTTLASTALLAQTAPDMAAGEVKKIDKEAQKITLKHGEIKNMEMPPMTMVFKALDPALLDRVKVGDKVNFSAEKRDGAIVITTIEVAK
jgi:Cu(I)/Ag(I) efflux system periplasmic protein CusF